MGEIKSAWEIAQEKANKLGELSPEERQKQRQDRCRLLGQSLAQKYLSQYDSQYLQAELNKYDSGDKELISQAALRRLAEGIDLGFGHMLDRISPGILTLARTGTATETVARIRELSREYQEAEELERQEIERAGREILHQLRISGTAVSHVNIRAKGEWQEKVSRLAQPFQERLDTLKQELLDSTPV